MKGFNFSTALVLLKNPWTCRNCLSRAQTGLKGAKQIKSYSTRSRRIPGPKTKGRILFAATGGALGATAIAFAEPVTHAYEATERTGRVVSALAICINE
jgi:aarF domain-containing kinase